MESLFQIIQKLNDIGFTIKFNPEKYLYNWVDIKSCYSDRGFSFMLTKTTSEEKTIEEIKKYYKYFTNTEL